MWFLIVFVSFPFLLCWGCNITVISDKMFSSNSVVIFELHALTVVIIILGSAKRSYTLQVKET